MGAGLKTTRPGVLFGGAWFMAAHGEGWIMRQPAPEGRACHHAHSAHRQPPLLKGLYTVCCV